MISAGLSKERAAETKALFAERPILCPAFQGAAPSKSSLPGDLDFSFSAI